MQHIAPFRIVMGLIAVLTLSASIGTPRSGEFSYAVKPWYKHRKDGKAGREIMLYFNGNPLKGPATVSINAGTAKETLQVNPSAPLDSLAVLLPGGIGVTDAEVTISIAAGKTEHSATVTVPAKKQWTVYIYPHAHVDIGYTNLQSVVDQLHRRNIDVGIDIAAKTQNYPAGAKFVWNPEATWVVNNYLKNASSTQIGNFKDAVQKGWVQIDGAHSNMNTGTCSDEELLKIFNNNTEIESLTGVPVTTMVQVDNPGASWGLVQAAAQNGIKGFFSFPNYYDLRHNWENKPFYWRSQDGQHKLFFLQGVSYGYGFQAKGRIYGLGRIQAFTASYDRLTTSDPLDNFIDPYIFNETAKLEKADSPYDIFAMTWSMADNCLIDADLPEAVKTWNERYAYPKLIIAGTKAIMEAYESKYSDIIPEVKGDFTEFWTNGLGSDARRVGLGRRAKEELVQAETLGILLGKPADPHVIGNAWENILLSAEHTWGFQDPRAPMAKQVEGIKAGYFENAKRQSETILKALTANAPKSSHSIAVVNTLSWSRSGLVTLTPDQSAAGDRIVDASGKHLVTQRLSNGNLVFLAENIPALGTKMYKLMPGKSDVSAHLMINGNSISNGTIRLKIDETTGNITSLTDLKTRWDFAGNTQGISINNYNYVTGVFNGKDRPGKPAHDEQISIAVKENGPLVASLLVSSEGPGTTGITREVKLVKDQPEVQITNTVEKTATMTKEAVHWGFDFHIPDGEMKLDIPMGIISPEYDQLASANRNWLAFQRWVNISNAQHGVTWTSIESPLIEIGELSGNILDGARLARLWKKQLNKSQTLYSWMLNNHWDTNFPLQQEGTISSSFAIKLHGGYNATEANRFGVEQHRPLLAMMTPADPVRIKLAIDNPNVMISTLKRSADNKALIVHLRSLSATEESIKLTSDKQLDIFSSNASEKQLNKMSKLVMAPYGFMILRINNL